MAANPSGPGSNTDRISINDLKQASGVSFGTSGVRGLVKDMTDRVCYAYAKAFLQYLQDRGELRQGTEVGLGGDLRPSTPRVLAAAAQAAKEMGCTPRNFGKIASPALAYYGITHRIPTVMVTGSHIPADRNGIKFTTTAGEISKDDETGITAQTVEIPAGAFNAEGMFTEAPEEQPASEDAWELYKRRYLEFFPPGFLNGKRIGVYQHSAVIRDVMVEVLERLGAQVTPLGRSDEFIPVDTEAIREEDVQLAREWAGQHPFDCIVSADGDSDRPLISDERGHWLRGDVAGILCAGYLGADSVTTPVSSNTAVEKCGWFKQVDRTKIGSPFVIASMEEAMRAGFKRVAGYEANGGFLIASDLEREGRKLRALPTRDALILQLSILGLSIEQGRSIAGLLEELPQRFTYSDRLKEFPTEKSRAILAQLYTGEGEQDRETINTAFEPITGTGVDEIDTTDGLRMTFGPEIIHLRPSGNAPEFRCYTEADTPERAIELNQQVMALLRQWQV
ncbi:MAG: phosphomannomutase [Armatimonadetes bacterium]|nr:phosphomannomutase [Armatimonadota bacterium]